MCSGIFENRIIAQNNIAALEKRAAIDWLDARPAFRDPT